MVWNAAPALPWPTCRRRRCPGRRRRQVGKTIRIGGWVKTGREAGAGAFAFLEVNDGSCFQNIQVRCTGHARLPAAA